MDKKIKEVLKIIIFVVLLISLIVLIVQIKINNVLKIDEVIYKNCIEIRNDKLNNFFKIVTYLGDVFITLVITIIACIFIKKNKYRKIIIINLFNIIIFNLILKNIFMRPRPNVARLINEVGYSFPSGHAMVTTAFYGLFIYLVFKELKNRKLLKIIMTIVLSFLICLISVSRVYLGVHYFSDILGGILISSLYLMIYIFIVEKCEKNI